MGLIHIFNFKHTTYANNNTVYNIITKHVLRKQCVLLQQKMYHMYIYDQFSNNLFP